MAPVSQDGNIADLLVEKLHSDGIIGSNSFGVNYRSNDSSSDSMITLGGFDESVVPSNSSFTWVDLKTTSYWGLDLK